MNTTALFAGQGAQFVGMGADLDDPVAKDLFARASAVLGYDLADLCFNGPIESLTSSDHCQPAIFTVSAACFELFRKQYPQVGFSSMAGLSLGEWTALYAAGVIDFESGVKILEARGRYMQEACDATPTGMASVVKLTADKVREIAERTGAHVSNVNSQMQIVLSGTSDVLAAAAKEVSEAKGRAIPLKVAGAFHSPYMEPARAKLAEVLDTVEFKAPRTPVLSNARGAFHDPDAAAIKKAMLDQVTGTVLWLDCMTASGSTNFIEFGPGKTLSGLATRINPEFKAYSVQDRATLDAYAQQEA